MARTAQIDYQRMTFSFPKSVVVRLRKNIGKNMSQYVVRLIEEDFEKIDSSEEDLFERLDRFSKNVKFKTDKSSLEILREIRHAKR